MKGIIRLGHYIRVRMFLIQALLSSIQNIYIYMYIFFAFIAFGFFLSLSRSRFFSVSRVLTEENSSVEAFNVRCLDDSYNRKCRYISTHIALLYVVAWCLGIESLAIFPLSIFLFLLEGDFICSLEVFSQKIIPCKCTWAWNCFPCQYPVLHADKFSHIKPR